MRDLLRHRLACGDVLGLLDAAPTAEPLADLDTLHHYTRLAIADLKKTHARCHPWERED